MVTPGGPPPIRKIGAHRSVAGFRQVALRARATSRDLSRSQRDFSERRDLKFSLCSRCLKVVVLWACLLREVAPWSFGKTSTALTPGNFPLDTHTSKKLNVSIEEHA